MKRIKVFLIVSLISIPNIFAQITEEMKLPAWSEGEMEIHHIQTGRGNAVFCIFPDGTTMLIDAGDIGPYRDPRTTPALPNNSKQPGEWIARYIIKRLDFAKQKRIDYAFLSHFHADHMGGVYNISPKTGQGGDYFLSGLTEVYEYIPFFKLVDRDWPTYSNPDTLKGLAIENYKKFIAWQQEKGKLKVERFISGSNSQFELINQPEKYPAFEIRNIFSTGELWTGDGEKTRRLFPSGTKLHENKLSAGIRISYGKFNYFNGADINGRLPINTEQWRDVETPVGEVIGTIEVCTANHHAWIDAMNEQYLKHVKPQIIVIQAWHVTHLNLSVLQSMLNKRINPNLQHIIPTNIPEISKAYLGDEQINKLTGCGGHVVIKVEPGGDAFSVYLVNETDESFNVKTIYGPFKCN